MSKESRNEKKKMVVLGKRIFSFNMVTSLNSHERKMAANLCECKDEYKSDYARVRFYPV